MKLNSLEFGEGNPFIILHGLFGFSDNWISHAKKISDYYKVILLDLRNHGHSPWSNDFNYDLMADDVLEYINKNNLKNIILLGHSMGGKVAIEFAKKNEHIIEKLIVVDIGIKKYPMHHEQIILGLNSIKLSSELTRKEAENQISKYIDSEGVKQFLLKNLYWDSKKELKWRMNLKVIESKIDEILKEIEINNPINIPTLFLRGMLSGYILEEDLSLIDEKFNDLKIVDIENAGHWIHAEKPTEFINSVLEFCLR